MGSRQNCSYPLQEEELLYLEQLQQQGESVGGQVKLTVGHVPPSLGEPVFDKLKADLAKAVMSIGAVTSFSYGAGENFAQLTGLQCRQERTLFGGIEGGISNGEDIVITFTVKPTSTVGEWAKSGRHDPCIIPRVIPVVEAMVHFTLADHYLRQQVYEQYKGC
jgi:chorismate synthase